VGPQAFVRTGEAGIIEEILRVCFTLKLLLNLVGAGLLAAGAALFSHEHSRWVF
jgi:hypothetical protein